MRYADKEHEHLMLAICFGSKASAFLLAEIVRAKYFSDNVRLKKYLYFVVELLTNIPV